MTRKIRSQRPQANSVELTRLRACCFDMSTNFRARQAPLKNMQNYVKFALPIRMSVFGTCSFIAVHILSARHYSLTTYGSRITVLKSGYIDYTVDNLVTVSIEYYHRQMWEKSVELDILLSTDKRELLIRYTLLTEQLKPMYRLRIFRGMLLTYFFLIRAK